MLISLRAALILLLVPLMHEGGYAQRVNDENGSVMTVLRHEIPQPAWSNSHGDGISDQPYVEPAPLLSEDEREGEMGHAYGDGGGKWVLGIFPNPVRGRSMSIRYGVGDGEFSLLLVDARGRLVRSAVIGRTEGGEGEVAFDIVGIPAGRYFLSLQGNERMSMEPVMIMR